MEQNGWFGTSMEMYTFERNPKYLAVRKALFLWGNFLLKGVAGIFVYSKFEE
jgi:hypothetical protein